MNYRYNKLKIKVTYYIIAMVNTKPLAKIIKRHWTIIFKFECKLCVWTSNNITIVTKIEIFNINNKLIK